MPRKTAMVAPKPETTAEERCAELLHQLGNERPFTLIRSHGHSFKVLFSGDYTPSILKQVDGQWVILSE